MYGDFGTETCANYLGSEYYIQMDANTFAEWDVDYLMLDGCNSDTQQFTDGKWAHPSNSSLRPNSLLPWPRGLPAPQVLLCLVSKTKMYPNYDYCIGQSSPSQGSIVIFQ